MPDNVSNTDRKDTDARRSTTSGPNRGAGSTLSSSVAWYEVVKGLRAYYDHFRIVFPDLEPLPRYYSADWVENFKEGARQFVRTEDMESVRRAIESNATQAKPAPASLGEQRNGNRTQTSAAQSEEITNARDVLGDEYWSALIEYPEAFRAVVEQMLNPEAKPSASAKGAPEVDTSDSTETPVAEPASTTSGGPEVAPPDSTETPEAVTPPSGPTEDEAEETGPDLEKEDKDLMMEVDELARSVKDSQQEIRNLQAQLVDKDGEIQKVATELKKSQVQIEKLKEAMQSGQERRVTAPSELGQKLKELEQTLAAAEIRISGLQQKLDDDVQSIEELKEALTRNGDLRRKFEMDMEEERRSLREQIRRMDDLLSGGAEIPSLEEFEQMSGGELLEYVEDVETEKQRALASLEAIDAQEESYQSQLKAQQDELETVQEDLEQYKESNLATEVGSLRDTIGKQRDQLESLLNFSKSLQSQNEHLKERQEPLRRIVERLNLQEKALVRFVRMNYDQDFMPSQALPHLSEDPAKQGGK